MGTNEKNMTAGSPGKLIITFATYAYKFDENGKVVESDRTEWSYGRFGRFQGYSGSFSYTLNNDTFKKLFGKGDDKDKEKDKKDTDTEEDDEDL